VPTAPVASCAVKKAHELVTTGKAEQSDIPCAMVLTAAPCSPRCPPGPHGLAVRKRIARPTMPCVHRIPLPTFVTMRNAPLVAAGRAYDKQKFLENEREIFKFPAGRPEQLESPHEIRFLAHVD
jgi:hypothetical protein